MHDTTSYAEYFIVVEKGYSFIHVIYFLWKWAGIFLECI